jgi:hypothetical protein
VDPRLGVAAVLFLLLGSPLARGKVHDRFHVRELAVALTRWGNRRGPCGNGSSMRSWVRVALSGGLLPAFLPAAGLPCPPSSFSWARDATGALGPNGPARSATLWSTKTLLSRWKRLSSGRVESTGVRSGHLHTSGVDHLGSYPRSKRGDQAFAVKCTVFASGKVWNAFS